MVYRLTSEELRDYVHDRIISPPLLGNFQLLLNSRKFGDSSLNLHTSSVGNVNSLSCLFSYQQGPLEDYVEMTLHPSRPGLDEKDVCRFLEKLVVGDRIFQEGFPLCPRYKPFAKNVSLAQRHFRRADSPTEDKIACYIAGNRLGNLQVIGLIYDYMVRPGLFYLFRMGEF